MSFCAHAILEPRHPLVVPNARADRRFADSPLVVDGAIRFYAGAPVLANGMPIGTVCVVDREPRTLSPSQVAALQALSRLVSRMIELRKAGRLLSLHLREREWYRRQLAEHDRALQAPAPERTGHRAADELRGLPDRAAFVAALAEAIDTRGPGDALQVALIEIDGLSSLAEIRGPDEADHVVGAVARALQSGRRAEERLAWLDPGFGLLMALPLNQAMAQCHVLGERVADPGAGIPITLSIDVARAEPRKTAANVLETAEHAVAQARAAGGNRIEMR